MDYSMRTLLAWALWFGCTVASSAEEHWPGFRGPTGDGRSSAAQTPLRWTEQQHVAWKSAVPGLGWSSPVVWGKQVWVTTATLDGKELSALCLELASGKIVQTIKVFEVEKPEPKIVGGTSYASPTPAIEDGRIYVHYGTYGTACLDTATGKPLWARRDLTLDHKEGAGSSPLLCGELLVIPCDGQDVQYLIALDKQTGKTVWKTPRSADFRESVPYQRKAYTTTLLVEHDAKRLLISVGARGVYGYEPLTGKELWRATCKGWSNVSNPVYGHGLVFANTGYGQQELWAVRPDGKGEVTDSHVAWKLARGVPGLSSPVLVGEHLYFATEKGIASCVQAKTGKVVWQERLGGTFSASPVAVGDRLYFTAEDGLTTVLRAAPTFEILATNRLAGTVKASPAVVGKSLILRTDSHLYRVEE